MSNWLGHITQAFKDKAFVICAVVLLVSAVGLDGAARSLQLHFRKQAVPLRKNLSELDADKLWPYKVVDRAKLTSEMREALGTDQYLHWLLEDTSVSNANQVGRYVTLFVTYYPLGADQVPHVPEECYVGGGYESVGSKTVDLTVPGSGLADDKLTVRQMLFKSPSQLMGQIRPVIYFFSVSGKFKATRTGARLVLSDIRSKYAYLSKVEIAFKGPVPPGKRKSLELAEKVLGCVLPVLVNEHWPTWPPSESK